jgi:acyl carrier protein
MNKKEIFNKVNEIFIAEFAFYDKKVTLETTFDDIIGHKLDKKEFVLQVEEFFELKIASRNLSTINTINDLVEHLFRLL